MWKWFFGPVLVTKLDRLGTYAAAMAYCFVLSVVPFLIVTFTFADQLQLDLRGGYREILADILPSGIDANQVLTTIDRSSHSGIATIGFILAVYTSYNLMTQITRTLLFIFDDPKRPEGWNWRHWVKSAVLLFIWMFLLLVIAVSFVVTIGIESILRQIDVHLRVGTAVIGIAQYALVIASMFFAFLLTFLLVPAQRPSLMEARDGSLVASCGWILCSLLFANLLPQMLRAGAVYEALGSVVVILLWAQACAWSVIIGACWIVRFSPRR